MPKKSFGRRKGAHRNILKQRAGSKETVRGVEGENKTEDSEVLVTSRSLLSSFSEKCFGLSFSYCEKFHLIGFTRTQNGEYVPLSRKSLVWHYVTVVCCVALCMQKTWGTLQVFLYQELRMESFMCLSVSMAYTAAFLLALGVLMRPKESTNLLNSWPRISDSLKIVDDKSNYHPLGNNSACFKVISSLFVGQVIAVAVTIMSLIVSDLPIFLFPMAKRFGLLPESIVPIWVWQIMFTPAEWLTALPFMLIAPLCPSFLFMENGLLEIYLQKLRTIKVNSIRSRRRVEQLYVQLELFNRIAQDWIRFFFPLWLFANSSAIAVTVFVTIRYTELPLIFYMFFPYTAFTLMLLIFWQSYDMLRVIRASEDILGGLWQHHAPYFQLMTRARRIEKIKRSKAMRPLMFCLADSKFSVSLPVNTWDKIVGQTTFLLSL